MREVEAVKTGEQRQQVEAHLAGQGRIYADIWKVGVNTALRISDLLSCRVYSASPTATMKLTAS